MSIRSSTRRFIVGALSLLCLAELFTLTVLAAAPALHQHFHHDADKADHECVVTLFAAGKLDIASPSLNQTPPSCPVMAVVPLTPAPVFFSIHYQFRPGRAPPSPLV